MALISLIIPARNEEANIQRLEREVTAVADALPHEFEFLVVDNASTDATSRMVRELCERDRRWRYIRFSRNFTVEMSITAGYDFARGDAMIVLYSDLQDPPDVIPAFIDKWKEGFDVVYGVRTVRPGDAKWRNGAVRMAYRMIAWFSDVPIPLDAGDFRLISMRVRDALSQCGERNRYMRGLIAWLGFRQTGVYYERRPRLAGESKAPLIDLLWFVFNAVTSFSLKPLRMFTFLGFFMIAASTIMAFIYTALYLRGSPPPGITTILVLLLMSIGLNSLGIGVIGEYIGRTFTEAKHRPLLPASAASRWKSLAVIIGVALLAHGLMMLNDGIFWDDWLLLDYLRSGLRSEVWHLATDRGIPTDAPIWFAIGMLPGLVVSYKIVVVAGLAMSGCLVYGCLTACGLPRREATVGGCLAVAYPGVEAWVVLSITQYLVYYVLFLAAALIALRSQNNPSRRAIGHSVAAVLFYLSYGLNSLLMWSVGFCLLLFARELRRQRIQVATAQVGPLARIAVQSSYPFGAAILYWVVKRILFPPVGVYAGYNAFRIDAGTLRLPLSFAANGVVRPLLWSIQALASFPLLLIAAIVVAVVWTKRDSRDLARHRWAPLLAASIIGGILAVTPYALVGLAPSHHGWSTRHNILLAVPVALGFLGLWELAVSLFPRTVRIANGVIVLVVAAFAARCAQTQLQWIGRWASTRAIARSLPPPAQAASLVWLDDRVTGPTEEPYRFYEWSAMLYENDHRERHLVLPYTGASEDQIEQSQPYMTRTYRLAEWRTQGCQTAARVETGPAWKSLTINGETYVKRRLMRRESLAAWLDSLVTSRPLPVPIGGRPDCDR
jgi:polyisoprenyl-phosphate glycosyltransferase